MTNFESKLEKTMNQFKTNAHRSKNSTNNSKNLIEVAHNANTANYQPLPNIESNKLLPTTVEAPLPPPPPPQFQQQSVSQNSSVIGINNVELDIKDRTKVDGQSPNIEQNDIKVPQGSPHRTQEKNNDYNQVKFDMMDLINFQNKDVLYCFNNAKNTGKQAVVQYNSGSNCNNNQNVNEQVMTEQKNDEIFMMENEPQQERISGMGGSGTDRDNYLNFDDQNMNSNQNFSNNDGQFTKNDATSGSYFYNEQKIDFVEEITPRLEFDGANINKGRMSSLEHSSREAKVHPPPPPPPGPFSSRGPTGPPPPGPPNSKNPANRPRQKNPRIVSNFPNHFEGNPEKPITNKDAPFDPQPRHTQILDEESPTKIKSSTKKMNPFSPQKQRFDSPKIDDETIEEKLTSSYRDPNPHNNITDDINPTNYFEDLLEDPWQPANTHNTIDNTKVGMGNDMTYETHLNGKTLEFNEDKADNNSEVKDFFGALNFEKTTPNQKMDCDLPGDLANPNETNDMGDHNNLNVVNKWDTKYGNSATSSNGKKDKPKIVHDNPFNFGGLTAPVDNHVNSGSLEDLTLKSDNVVANVGYYNINDTKSHHNLSTQNQPVPNVKKQKPNIKQLDSNGFDFASANNVRFFNFHNKKRTVLDTMDRHKRWSPRQIIQITISLKSKISIPHRSCQINGHSKK